MASGSNNPKAGMFDYIMLIIGCGIIIIGLKLLLAGSFSFLSENFDVLDGPLPGLFVLAFGFVAFYYSFKKIVSSKKNDP